MFTVNHQINRLVRLKPRSLAIRLYHKESLVHQPDASSAELLIIKRYPIVLMIAVTAWIYWRLIKMF